MPRSMAVPAWVILGAIETEDIESHDQPYSAKVTLPPLAAVWFRPEDTKK